MQCFQKDPNLRVSARKLLKHPWIATAHRTESVVPKKPTEYEEAVKSVQEWNEALRSPDSATVRRPGRVSDYQGPRTTRLDPINTGLRAKESSSVPSITTKHPSGTEDNWDDDFDSAISPRALNLPHLRPHDHLGGILSSERLKAFASLDGTTVRDASGSFSENDTTLGIPESDPLETIRPLPRKLDEKDRPHIKSRSRHRASQSVPAVSIMQPSSTSNLEASPPNHSRQPRPTAFYTESADEDFSDLIVANDDALERKLGIFSVSSSFYRSCLLLSNGSQAIRNLKKMLQILRC